VSAVNERDRRRIDPVTGGPREVQRRPASELIQSAKGRGTLSARSTDALAQPSIATQVQAALLRSYSVTKAGKLLLITLMPDDSGSMFGLKKESVIAGHNELLEDMKKGPEGKRTMLQTRYLNGRTLNPFSPLDVCLPLSIDNYRCDSGTPLFEQTLVVLGTVMAKTEELTSLGVQFRTASLLMTDGLSTEKNKSTLSAEVASVIEDMRRVGDHSVAGMGITLSERDTGYRDVFLKMGIEPQHIFPADSREEILRAFRVFRRSAVAQLTAGSGTLRKDL